MQPTDTTYNYSIPKRKTALGVRRSAWLEMALALAALLAFDALVLHSHRYWDINPHPFWLIVLLMAGKYGTKEGLIAAILSSIALLFGNLPEQFANEDAYAYSMKVLALPMLWLVSAVIFGELRQMHIRERDQLEKSLTDSSAREQYIAQSYQWVKKLKDDLELRVAGQLRSSISAYHAAKNMESLSPQEVIRGLEDLVSTTLHPEQFSIYMLSDDGLSANLTHGWREEDGYARTFSKSSALYNSVIGGQHVLCVANADHERVLNGQAMLAGPLVDRDSGQVVGMLKVEKLGFTDLHLSNIEAFTTLCEWAGMAVVNARKYQAAKAGSITNPDHNLLTHSYFQRFTDFISSLAERVNFDVSVVTIKHANAEQFNETSRSTIARALSQSVDSVLRNIDLAFDHQDKSEQYNIVLPSTDLKGANVVVDKIQAQLAKQLGKLAKEAQFTFTTQAIYDKRAK